MIEIVNYTEQTKEHVKTLNYEWLEKYFAVEPNDVIQLADPKTEIIDKGGLIYYAKNEGLIVGTVSLLKVDEDVYELGKMAVSEKAQGLGIGKIMIEHCFKVAREIGIFKLVLYSNTSLKPAIHLYEKYGFKAITLEPGHYGRANIKMEKVLSLPLDGSS
jgi:ribosomal protein S18 acetylase RimI-like enzyme